MYFAPLVGEIGTDKDGVDFVKLCVRAHNSDVDDAGVHNSSFILNNGDKDETGK